MVFILLLTILKKLSLSTERKAKKEVDQGCHVLRFVQLLDYELYPRAMLAAFFMHG